MTTTLYLSYEPEHRMIAERLVDWPLAQPDFDAYDAGAATDPDGDSGEAVRADRRRRIAAADVLVCIVGQTTFLDPWVNWEIRTYLEKPNRRGMVGIMLHDLNSPPPDMIDRGSIYIRFKRDAMEAAVEAAMTADDLTEDFVLDD